MATLQERLDNLAARVQLFNRMSRVVFAIKDPIKQASLERSITKYIEPQKLRQELDLFLADLSESTKKSYGAKDIIRLIMKHKPGVVKMPPDIGALAIGLVLAGIKISLILAGAFWGVSQIVYKYKVADAEAEMRKENPWAFVATTAMGTITMLALIGGAIFLLPKILKKGAT